MGWTMEYVVWRSEGGFDSMSCFFPSYFFCSKINETFLFVKVFQEKHFIYFKTIFYLFQNEKRINLTKESTNVQYIKHVKRSLKL